MGKASLSIKDFVGMDPVCIESDPVCVESVSAKTEAKTSSKEVSMLKIKPLVDGVKPSCLVDWKANKCASNSSLHCVAVVQTLTFEIFASVGLDDLGASPHLTLGHFGFFPKCEWCGVVGMSSPFASF